MTDLRIIYPDTILLEISYEIVQYYSWKQTIKIQKGNFYFDLFNEDLKLDNSENI